MLFDGACPFCRAQVARLLRLTGEDGIEALDLNDPSVPERYPELSREALITAMHLVAPDGRVYSGCEAVVRALASRPILGRLVLLYYVPGIRQLAEWAYRAVAKRRYRLMANEPGGCPDGACSLHQPGTGQRAS